MSAAATQTITLTLDQMVYVQSVTLTQMRDDRAQIVRLPVTGFDGFLAKQIAVGTEVMNALNAAIEGEMRGEILEATLAALHFAMHVRNMSYSRSLNEALDGMSIRRVSFTSMDDARRFLENLK